MHICLCQPCSTQTHSYPEGDRQVDAFTPFQYKQHIKSSNQPLRLNLFQKSVLLHQDLSAHKFYWIKFSQLIIPNLPKAHPPHHGVSLQLHRNHTEAVHTFPQKTLEG
ncbi:hypothetical protein O181_010166 [Austropuccinia psidii MF-1]|uniref:Uncharacterized protein n=1 Tax=Austropuccinia psidii MF-1 TaxID=1389203 RepID=A0A9Q3BT88_9BASI|nr:hypothetical protein [Austropuccinia psidii MF-1]